MFKKILLPLDGSATAERALAWCKLYAPPSKAQVVLLQILHAEYPLKGLPFRAGAAEARAYLQGIERELNFAGIPARIALRNEPVARSIVATADREGCDLIVMTSRGASRVVRWLIGGVAQQVVRLSHVPVLVIRGTANPDKRLRRILVPQDGSAGARAILPWAARLAHLHRVNLTILHVSAGKEPHPDVARMMARHRAAMVRRGGSVSLQFEQGDPAEGILKASRPGDLIAVTTHGRGGLKRLILGSVAEKVVTQASVPVAIYKKPVSLVPLPKDFEALELFDR